MPGHDDHSCPTRSIAGRAASLHQCQSWVESGRYLGLASNLLIDEGSPNVDARGDDPSDGFKRTDEDEVLGDLFRLDGTPATFGPGAQPPMSPGDVVSNTVFDQRRWEPPPHRRLRNVTFRNVAFSKAMLVRVTFIDCTFEDCLFVGTRFSEVEFHGCKFVDCNMWKARFRQVYLDPDTIRFDHRFKVEAANTGISVFQALLTNFADERQDQFYMRADIRFRRWKRYQIWSDVRRKRISRAAGLWSWLCSITYEVLAGFGYRPLRFLWSTVVLFLGFALLNHRFINDAVQINGAPPVSFVDTIFYTFSILTGFSSVVPVTDIAKLLTVMEALAAIGWLGIFTSILVKRFLR